MVIPLKISYAMDESFGNQRDNLHTHLILKQAPVPISTHSSPQTQWAEGPLEGTQRCWLFLMLLGILLKWWGQALLSLHWKFRQVQGHIHNDGYLGSVAVQALDLIYYLYNTGTQIMYVYIIL